MPTAGAGAADPSLPESLIPTLAGHYYTHPEVFALEQKNIFEQMWFCVVRASDLDKPGAFKTVQVGRESVLVARSCKGEINAFFNLCRHRGARLCTEESGQVKRAFQCPYHAWMYDLDGKLIAAPNLTKMPDVDRVEYGLRTIAVKEWLGYVWVCLADDPPSFENTVSRSVELFHRANQQDFDACERCQPAMDSRVYAAGGVLVPSEHHIGAFHDWLRDQLAE